MKDAHVELQKAMTRTKKIREREARKKEGMHWEWDAIQEMKIFKITKFDNEAIMFEKTLEFKQAILLCYHKHKKLTLQ